MSALGGAIVGGAIGGGLSIIVLAPLNAANNFIGSYYFGSGMILGERDMYQEDWPKIKARLDKGESFITIVEEYTIRNTTMVMSQAKQIVIQVKGEWFDIVRQYLSSIPVDILKFLNEATAGGSQLSLMEQILKLLIGKTGPTTTEEKSDTEFLHDLGLGAAGDSGPTIVTADPTEEISSLSEPFWKWLQKTPTYAQVYAMTTSISHSAKDINTNIGHISTYWSENPALKSKLIKALKKYREATYNEKADSTSAIPTTKPTYDELTEMEQFNKWFANFQKVFDKYKVAPIGSSTHKDLKKKLQNMMVLAKNPPLKYNKKIQAFIKGIKL